MSNAICPLNILVLYNSNSVGTIFVAQHLNAISNHSRHNISFAPATFNRRADYPLELFDALIVHFSVRLPWKGVMSEDFSDKVAAFVGPKVLMIQDEYDLPQRACDAIRRLGIQFVFTTVPETYRQVFYPTNAVPGVTFKQCLTGYVPDDLPDVQSIPSISERPLWIGYRGRKLPVWYGSLAHEKYEIGERMKIACQERLIPHDIEWSEEKRILGQSWFHFLASARVTLGTESGSNVVDHDGLIRKNVLEASNHNPTLTEHEIYRRYVEPFDNHVRMNQLSPKIFEAIALNTGLVLFEGEHSGVVQPDKHYIALRKDFRNIGEVLQKIGDAEFVQAMTERAYTDIISSGRYGYDKFIADVDKAVEGLAPASSSPKRFIWAAVQSSGDNRQWSTAIPHLPLSEPIAIDAANPPNSLLTGKARRIWLRLPVPIRKHFAAVLGPAARLLARTRNKTTSGAMRKNGAP